MNFALIGAAGYVAPKHLDAIRQCGGNLVAALDPHDSVGILDRYFPNCRYFSEFERFDRYCSMRSIDYVSICSPNYLHDAHCRFALRIGAEAICEKPLVLNVRNLRALQHIESQTGKKINVILQMRLHETVKSMPTGGRHYVRIRYIAPRGAWYQNSWKGDVQKSGGLCTNIGVHLFDLACCLYGPMENIFMQTNTSDEARGRVSLQNANVDFLLSTKGDIALREFRVDVEPFDFSTGFEDLHVQSYQHILFGNGFGTKDILPATTVCEAIRSWQ